MNRLFRHDRMIAWNAVRATFTGWRDRVIAALILFAVLATARTWAADQPWTVAAWAALVGGAVIGIAVGQLVAARLAFHAFDGLLAADALHPSMRKSCRAAWHGVGLALLAVTTLIVRPSLLMVTTPAYLAGVLVAEWIGGLGMSQAVFGTMRPRWRVRAWSHRPVTGISGAIILLLSLLPARTLGANAQMAVVGVETMLFALLLTNVDDAVVRFMTIAGHGSQRIVARHVGGLASFSAVGVTGCWFLIGPVAVGIFAATSAAMVLLLALRVFAYRLHAKRFADLLVSILAGLLLLVAYSLPPALPILVLAMLWHLQRRTRTKTWLLA